MAPIRAAVRLPLIFSSQARMASPDRNRITVALTARRYGTDSALAVTMLTRASIQNGKGG